MLSCETMSAFFQLFIFESIKFPSHVRVISTTSIFLLFLSVPLGTLLLLLLLLLLLVLVVVSCAQLWSLVVSCAQLWSLVVSCAQACTFVFSRARSLRLRSSRSRASTLLFSHISSYLSKSSSIALNSLLYVEVSHPLSGRVAMYFSISSMCFLPSSLPAAYQTIILRMMPAYSLLMKSRSNISCSKQIFTLPGLSVFFFLAIILSVKDCLKNSLPELHSVVHAS